MKAFSLIYILLTLLLTSCSKYTIEDGSRSGMDVNIKFQKNAAGSAFDMEYPVRVFCTDAAGKNIIDKTFRQGDEMKLFRLRKVSTVSVLSWVWMKGVICLRMALTENRWLL